MTPRLMPQPRCCPTKKSPQTKGLRRSLRSGGDETRTHDLFHAMEALYQLSYAPEGIRLSAAAAGFRAIAGGWLGRGGIVEGAPGAGKRGLKSLPRRGSQARVTAGDGCLGTWAPFFHLAHALGVVAGTVKS